MPNEKPAGLPLASAHHSRHASQVGGRSLETAVARRAVTVAGLLLLALLAASLPYLYGAAIRPSGFRFWAVPPVNGGDANQYLAFTRMAAEGAVLMGDPFTTEPHPPRLFMPQVLFQGLVSRLFGWSPVESFQLSRVLSGGLLLLAGTWLGFLLLRPWRLRRLFVVLLCFSAGAGWLLEWAGAEIPNGDLGQPEGNTFFTLSNLPHLALSSALLTGCGASLLAYERDQCPRWLWFAAAISALLSWTHPFDFLALGLTLGAYGSIRWVSERRPPLPLLRHGVALAAGALPAFVYLSWLTSTEPVYARLASDTLQVQSFWFYAISHGLLWLAALPVLCVAPLRRRYLFPLCWTAGVFLFLLLPLRLGGKQPRVVGGVHAPLALLAAAGLDWVARKAARRLPRGRPRAAAVTGIAVGWTFITAGSAYGMIQRHARTYTGPNPVYFHSPAVTEMYRVLARAAEPGDTVLGGPLTGGWSPTWANVRVYHGHWHMTLDEPAKRAKRDDFFKGPADPAARVWLREERIRWVIWYPFEWGVEERSWGEVPGLRRVFFSPEITLYRFDGLG